MIKNILLLFPFTLLALVCPRYSTADSALLGFGERAFTQEMQTDRPDFTEGAQTVQAGHVQLEAGYTYTKFSSSAASSESHSIPEALLRLGITEDFELRVFWEGYLEGREKISGEPFPNSSKGISDFSVGFKNRIFEQNEDIPSVSTLFELGIPSGASAVSSEEVVPTMKLLIEKDLNETFAVASNLNLSVLSESNAQFLEYSHSLTLGAALNDELGAYIEYYGFIPENGEEREDSHFLASGFTYAVNNNLQLDIRSAFGLNEASDDFLAGLGFSIRI